MKRSLALALFTVGWLVSGCTYDPRPEPSPHAYLHPPEVPHLLAELPKQPGR